MQTQMLSRRTTLNLSVLPVEIEDVDFHMSNTSPTMILTQDKVPKLAGELLHALRHQHQLIAAVSDVPEAVTQSMKSILTTIVSIILASKP